MFNTPVLLIIFNRPQNTRLIFEAIRQIKPKFLFIAADGPRKDKIEDSLKCEQSREIIDLIDWPCELSTLLRVENRGCGRGPSEAITWFFDHVEEGIVLEDDCLPNSSFFSFCEVMLARYRYDKDVFMIGGTNPLQRWKSGKNSYLFTLMGSSWGWASWRRAWNHFDYKMTAWQTHEGKQKIKDTLKNDYYFAHFEKEFDVVAKTNPDDIWDFQWLFTRWYCGAMTILPSVNLISNNGFHNHATHTFNEQDFLANLPTFNLSTPYKYSVKKVNKAFDWFVFEKSISTKKRTLLQKISFKVAQLTHMK